jgi:NAD(P)-dependent dehydrogenase (short-subunit alcohol dehydrogenase family)
MRHMGTRLEGRVAIVTGGGHGIGRAYCLALAREGARVVVSEIDGKAAEATRELVWGEGVETLALQTDVADEASTLAMARATVERFGRIDVLVNNAAVFATIPISRALIEEISVAEWDRVMAVNLRGVFLACRAVLPAMKAAGAGRIINISSGTAFNGSATRIHYVASKAGVLGFTRTLAREVGPHGITVNAIAPGSTLSEEHPTDETVRMRLASVQGRALARLELPDDLVGAVIFFASDESAFITGQTLVVDGGGFMH